MSKEYVEKLKLEMIDEFSNRIDFYNKNYRKLPKKELKKKIEELDNHVLETGERMGIFLLILASTIYKERFKREVILKGVQVDATGNIVRNDANNISSSL